jgi:hypothetical protein
VTNTTLTGLRLLNQWTAGPKCSARDVIAHLAAVQAQDYYGALWSIGLRSGQTESEIIAAVERLEIIRTWPHRGTLHYVLPEDAPWMVNLSAAKLIQGAKRRHENLELDSKTLGRSKELFAAALQGGRRLTRPAMMALLENAGISTHGGRGYHMLWYAAQTGLIYLGPMEGKQQTFGLLADLPFPARELSREEAIAELTRRYFTSHGPATIQDFAWWAGLTVAEVKAGLAASKSALISEKFEDREYWMAPESSAEAPPETLLLPGFDEYILGYKDRTAQVSAEHFNRIVPGGNGMFLSSVVRNGRVVGLWKRTLKKDIAVLEVSPFNSFTKKDVSAIQRKAGEYGKFLQLKCEVVFDEGGQPSLV